MKKANANEGVIVGDIISISKGILESKNNSKGFIKYGILLQQETRYKDTVKIREVMIEFLRTDESKEIEALSEGDNVMVWFYVESREHKGAYFNSIRGSHVKVLIKNEQEEPVAKKSYVIKSVDNKQQNLSDDEDIPF